LSDSGKGNQAVWTISLKILIVCNLFKNDKLSKEVIFYHSTKLISSIIENTRYFIYLVIILLSIYYKWD